MSEDTILPVAELLSLDRVVNDSLGCSIFINVHVGEMVLHLLSDGSLSSKDLDLWILFNAEGASPSEQIHDSIRWN